MNFTRWRSKSPAAHEESSVHSKLDDEPPLEAATKLPFRKQLVRRTPSSGAAPAPAPGPGPPLAAAAAADDDAADDDAAAGRGRAATF